MSFSLKGKVVLITGSSRGIGAGIARSVIAAGGVPIVCYRKNKDLAHKLCDELGVSDCIQLDTSNKKHIEHALNYIERKYRKLDALVNNAGILEQKPMLEINENEWDEMFSVNLKGPFLLTQAVLKRYLVSENNDLRIVNISSVGGQIGGPKAPHYAASKGAMLTFTKSCARLYAAEGVRVNAIAPGFIKTEMYEHILKRQSEEDILAGIPLGLAGEVTDIGDAVVYLCSQAGSYITGQVINVNGGVYMP